MNTSTSPIIEINGTGIHNRGAELMAIAISEKLKSVYPNVKVVVPSTFGYIHDLERYNFLVTSRIESKMKRAIFTLFYAFIKKKVVNSKKIDVILDASGFAFSDQWGEKAAQKLLSKSSKNKLLILLPQALGKFEKLEVRNSAVKLFDRAEIIFARDTLSYQYAKDIITDEKKLLQCPDFTVGIDPKKDETISCPNSFVAIVPNIRMLDKMGNSEAYLIFLRHSIRKLKDNGLEPVFIIHDSHEDRNVIGMLGEEYKKLKVIQHQDPRVLKWILGQAQFVIGSRFHALVSTMSQGVPCIGAGWSHKYPELFADFANREALIDDLSDLASLEKQIKAFSDDITHKERSQLIKSAADELKGKVEKMWELVINQINQHIQKN